MTQDFVSGNICMSNTSEFKYLRASKNSMMQKTPHKKQQQMEQEKMQLSLDLISC